MLAASQGPASLCGSRGLCWQSVKVQHPCGDPGGYAGSESKASTPVWVQGATLAVQDSTPVWIQGATLAVQDSTPVGIQGAMLAVKQGPAPLWGSRELCWQRVNGQLPCVGPGGVH